MKKISLIIILFLALPLNAGLFDYFGPKTLKPSAAGIVCSIGYSLLRKAKKNWFKKTNNFVNSLAIKDRVIHCFGGLTGRAFSDQQKSSNDVKGFNDDSGQGELIAEALQSEVVFTHQNDPKPIAATYGCGPCVAFGAYDDTNKFVALAHFSTAAEVREAQSMILDRMSTFVKTPITKPMQVHLRGGHKNISEETIEAIHMLMKLRNDIPMEIASEDILVEDFGNWGAGKSLLIDSRTGRVDSYNPSSNPHRRDFGQFEVMQAILSAFNPNVRIAYPPEYSNHRQPKVYLSNESLFSRN